MSFQRLNLSPFARGDDWTVQFTMTDENNLPIDITGNTYWMTLKENSTDPDPGAAQISVVAGGTDGAGGIIVMAFDSSDTSSLSPGNYHYDLQEVDQIGNVYTLLIGKVRVVRDITISTT